MHYEIVEMNSVKCNMGIIIGTCVPDEPEPSDASVVRLRRVIYGKLCRQNLYSIKLIVGKVSVKLIFFFKSEML